MAEDIHFREDHKPACLTLRPLPATTRLVRMLKPTQRGAYNPDSPWATWQIFLDQVKNAFPSGTQDQLFALGVNEEEWRAIAQIVYFREPNLLGRLQPDRFDNRTCGRYELRHNWFHAWKVEIPGHRPVTIQGIYKIDNPEASEAFVRVKQTLGETHREVLMYHGSLMSCQMAIADWGFIEQPGGLFFSSSSHFSMQYVAPWGELPMRIRTDEARRLTAAYEAERRRQSRRASRGDNRLSIPEPLLDPAARALLICRVLVPLRDVERAQPWQPPKWLGKEASISVLPFETGVVAQRCCPHILVHIGTGGA